MVQYHLITMDAWMREAQEASGLLEDIEIRIQNSKSQHLCNLRDSAKSKLLELGVMLDRLESLLHNPPSKPVLTSKEVDMRWKMLSDIQLRTRVIALSLFSLQSPERPGDLPATDTNATDKSADSSSQENSTTSDCDYDPEFLRPLVRDDSTEEHNQIKEDFALNMKTMLWKACWASCVILMGIAVFFAVLVLCAII